ncbi:hypothetical protein BOTBODRAFT_188822 [Botryobasidium botryosum FD-172 SS1]|uniref:Uncharacterized protein n=1 Tax=Botryobasidium botryosum (strain FD-172 SS1) TaxID=930990 RepID=A0A067MMF0_BOTB1|nr:hypothetical protein BOTBODRAFT_188822 [Botryobasidium botryosum FD-172 SS1]
MSTYFFEDKLSRQKRQVVCRRWILQFRRLVCGSKDIIYALRSFDSLVRGQPYTRTTYETRTWGGLLDFDAHPGDCACQIRPVALHHIFLKFTEHPEETRANLDRTIEILEGVHDRALALHSELCDKGTLPRELGEGFDKKMMTFDDLYQTAGFGQWFNTLEVPWPYAAGTAPSSDSSSCTSEGGVSTKGSTDTSPGACSPTSAASHVISSPVSRPGGSSVDHTSSCARQLASTLQPSAGVPGSVVETDLSQLRELSGKLRALQNVRRDGPHATWNVDDWRFVVQFITYANMLARFKVTYLSADGAAFVSRLSPELAWEEHLARDGAALECRYKMGQAKCPCTKKEETWHVVEDELEKMRKWMSQASSSLVQSLCSKSVLASQKLHLFAYDTYRCGPRSIGVLPIFLTILPLRQYWFDVSLSLFFIHQYFDTHGYHINYFRAVPGRITIDGGGAWPSPTGARYHFETEYIDPSDLDAALHEPHVCFIANAMEGKPNTLEDLTRLISTESPVVKPHRDATCGRNKAIVAKMLETSIDDLIMTFFAQHCDYPFETTDPNSDKKTNGSEPLHSAFNAYGMSNWQAYREALAQGAQTIGSGYAGADLCVTEHIFYERPRRIMDLFEERTKNERKIVPPGFIPLDI